MVGSGGSASGTALGLVGLMLDRLRGDRRTGVWGAGKRVDVSGTVTVAAGTVMRASGVCMCTSTSSVNGAGASKAGSVSVKTSITCSSSSVVGVRVSAVAVAVAVTTFRRDAGAAETPVGDKDSRSSTVVALES